MVDDPSLPLGNAVLRPGLGAADNITRRSLRRICRGPDCNIVRKTSSDAPDGLRRLAPLLSPVLSLFPLELPWPHRHAVVLVANVAPWMSPCG